MLYVFLCVSRFIVIYLNIDIKTKSKNEYYIRIEGVFFLFPIFFYFLFVG
jgi:hypothetical protein